MPFNYAEFDAECSNATEAELQKQWENYTRHISGGSTSTAVSILTAPLTMGVSLIGLGLSTPRIHNARKKREIIEKHLQALGSTHHTRKRDVFGPMALSGGIGLLTLGIAPPGAGSLNIAACSLFNFFCSFFSFRLCSNSSIPAPTPSTATCTTAFTAPGFATIAQIPFVVSISTMQFQRRKAEEDRIRVEKEKVQDVEEKGLKTSTMESPPPTYIEARDFSVKDQEGETPWQL